MASKSTLDPENFPGSGNFRGTPKGHDIGSLGPSDSSDSGSDLAGFRPDAGDGLRLDRGADEDGAGGHANDIDTDRVVGIEEAGLGDGLDQAEEAQLGVRDDDRGALKGSPSGGGRPSDQRSPGDRRRRVAEAAYYRAERRGFAPGSEDEDWLDAEREIDGDERNHRS